MHVEPQGLRKRVISDDPFFYVELDILLEPLSYTLDQRENELQTELNHYLIKYEHFNRSIVKYLRAHPKSMISYTY
jgi:hypothetical protein